MRTQWEAESVRIRSIRERQLGTECSNDEAAAMSVSLSAAFDRSISAVLGLMQMETERTACRSVGTAVRLSSVYVPSPSESVER